MVPSLTVILSPYDIDERVLNLNARTCLVAIVLDAVYVAWRAADTAIFLHIINSPSLLYVLSCASVIMILLTPLLWFMLCHRHATLLYLF